jgi:hypothetical protein
MFLHFTSHCRSSKRQFSILYFHLQLPPPPIPHKFTTCIPYSLLPAAQFHSIHSSHSILSSIKRSLSDLSVYLWPCNAFLYGKSHREAFIHIHWDGWGSRGGGGAAPQFCVIKDGCGQLSHLFPSCSLLLHLWKGFNGLAIVWERSQSLYYERLSVMGICSQCIRMKYSFQLADMRIEHNIFDN